MLQCRKIWAPQAAASHPPLVTQATQVLGQLRLQIAQARGQSLARSRAEQADDKRRKPRSLGAFFTHPSLEIDSGKKSKQTLVGRYSGL
jgi:hypothetical protein